MEEMPKRKIVKKRNVDANHLGEWLSIEEERSDIEGRDAEEENYIKRKGVFGGHIYLKDQGSQFIRNFGFGSMPLSKISKSRWWAGAVWSVQGINVFPSSSRPSLPPSIRSISAGFYFPHMDIYIYI